MALTARVPLPAYAAAVFLLMALVLVAHIMPIGGDAHIRGATFDAGHVLAFAIITALLMNTLRLNAPQLQLGRSSSQIVAIVVALVLAVVSEAAQYPTSRDADLADLGRDVCGIAVGVLVVNAFRMRSYRRNALLLLAFGGLVAGLQHPVGTLVARTLVWLEPRTTYGFESWFERFLVTSNTANLEVIQAPRKWHRDGHVLRVTLDGRIELEGMAHHGFPQDWAPYSGFSFSIGTEQKEPSILILILEGTTSADSRQRQFRKEFFVDTEPRSVSISVDDITDTLGSNQLGHTNIQHIMLLGQDAGGQSFFVDDLQLE